MKKCNQILLAASLFILSSVASAVPITGTIIFSGSLTTDTGDVLTADIFTFNNSIGVDSASGSFLPLSGGSVTYSVLDVTALPVAPLWSETVATVLYEFDLNNITLDGTLGLTRIIEGTGTFTIGVAHTGFGSWSFSTQNPGDAGTFTFSASNVPEPAILGLLGLGLIGMGATRKFRKA